MKPQNESPKDDLKSGKKFKFQNPRGASFLYCKRGVLKKGLILQAKNEAPGA
jgi:hypothetical protein